MKVQNPVTNEWVFFVDKCLPFGASISCAIFQRISDALAFLAERKMKVPRSITNYLDDFLFVALTLLKCNWMIQSFLRLCEQLGIPISAEKTEWGSLYTIFLGILLDGKNLTLAIPLDKRNKAIVLLSQMIDSKNPL